MFMFRSTGLPLTIQLIARMYPTSDVAAKAAEILSQLRSTVTPPTTEANG